MADSERRSRKSDDIVFRGLPIRVPGPVQPRKSSGAAAVPGAEFTAAPCSPNRGDWHASLTVLGRPRLAVAARWT
jgi:hypothetical protein